MSVGQMQEAQKMEQELGKVEEEGPELGQPEQVQLPQLLQFAFEVLEPEVERKEQG